MKKHKILKALALFLSYAVALATTGFIVWCIVIFGLGFFFASVLRALIISFVSILICVSFSYLFREVFNHD